MKDCFDPRSYGAVADGHSKDTAAVQAAIDAAAAQGGTVRLAGGTFVCGTLYLKSNVALEITNSATLLASPDIADYGTDTHHNRYRNEPELDRCFLFAQDAENVTICGSGVIDGNAAAFPNAGSIYRPMLLRVLRCRNVRVQNLRLLNAAAWATAFLDSDFIWATDLHIENHRNYNGDGLDFDSCRHVWVRGCYIDGTDDNLCLQSSGLPVQDVHISDCAFTSVCVGIRIGLKSIGEISGVVISNCTMRNIWREGIRIADKACRDMGIASPRIGVAGLNPHCGEGGLFGREEIDEITPAIEAARTAGINAQGPIPPDTIFSKALGGWYDIVVAMYHDQGHIPLKVVGFVYDREKQAWSAVEGVNITLGLPIIRTSVDHGTAFDQAGTGKANELSLKNAIEYAVRFAANR